MTTQLPHSLRHLPTAKLFKKGDVFVLFGELFGRGYANGLIDEARKAGMTIVGVTVGRRDDNDVLRALNADELAQAETDLGGKIVNVPLMAGFNLDAPAGQPTPTDLVNQMTLASWQTDKLDWPYVEQCRAIGTKRFTDSVTQAMAELDKLIPDGANVYFAHTMAGGIPKAKVFLAIANRIYKGRGARFMSSQALIDSDLGKLILANFDEVTANTFGHLIDGSAAIRARVEKTGGQVRYSAYGYHGTEVLIDGSYQWQTYTNYTQGYAKMRLERIAQEAWAKGIKASVFNCPEIRTNSSDIFVGVELSLFPLLAALKKEGDGAWVEAQWQACQALLQDGTSVEDLLQKVDSYLVSDTMTALRDFAAWPMPNNEALAEIMIGLSDELTHLHRDRKQLVIGHLSALVLEATGPLIFFGMTAPEAPVQWLNHDVVAKQLIALHK